ncbi:glycoside hydrolase family 15 protein [Streptomyces tailanensis]|uniref:glycoside hydrolase family 15 protein n=1 Tax=Streptomyces tailanensis TaxID=2569858 RepID=UPI003CCC5D03
MEDYALIGDHQTAALVSNLGSIDWLCLPRFDSAACFAALLGDEENGHWRIAPRGADACTRRAYRHDTLVLDTEWETDEGTVRVTDLMPQRDSSPDVVRVVEGLDGRVTVRSTLRLRFDYGSVVPWMRRSDGHRVALAGPDVVWLRSEPPVRAWGQGLQHALGVHPGRRREPSCSLSGYAGSRPVRVGNDAVRQTQLDVYGEVIDSLALSRRSGLPAKPHMWRMQSALMEYLRSVWPKPDEGLWEVRGPRRHFTHFKVMAWVAADRAVRTLEKEPKLSGDLDGRRPLREEIHHEVCERGFDADRNTFTQSYGSRELDASLLLIPVVRFLPPDDPRVVGTVDAIRAELSHDGFVRRCGSDHRPAASSVDGLPDSEGAFLVCSFWLADALHLTGRTEEACELFERLVGLVNDVGLLAEEYGPATGRQLGNFPQAFRHVGLVGTALALFDGDQAG